MEIVRTLPQKCLQLSLVEPVNWQRDGVCWLFDHKQKISASICGVSVALVHLYGAMIM